MICNNTAKRYSALSIGLHWLMLLLFIAVYATINLRELYPKGSDPCDALKVWHFMLGLSVFALLSLRLYARLSAPAPQITPQLVAWQLMVAKAMHIALYALMLVMPVLGWLVLSAAGKPIPFFGLELPALLAKNKAFASTLKEIHVFIGTTGYYLIALHALAALYHHYIKRDNTLKRMLPSAD
jgi:cytochrome b561